MNALTREFLLSRGRCCHNGCQNCPYVDEAPTLNCSKGVFVPRDYQQDAIDAFWAGTKSHKGENPLLCLPTGAGKTIVIAEILRGILDIGYRAVVLARSKELVSQNHDKFTRHLPGVDAGIYCAGLSKKQTDNDVVFATIQSICKNTKALGDRHLLIVDEAHQIPSREVSQYQLALAEFRERCPNALLLGLTASPYRLDGGVIHGPSRQFDYVAHSVPLSKLINDGYLTRPRTIDCEAIDLTGVKKSSGDFAKQDVEQRFLDTKDVITDQIVDAANEQSSKSVLVFASGVAHAETIKKRIRSRGESVELITGETLPLIRQSSLDTFDRGNIRFLVSIDTLTIGYDCTRVDHIAVCRATQSPGLFYQICGRGFRLHEGKEQCWIQDFGGNIDRHGPIDSGSYGINTIKVKGESGEAPKRVCPSCFMILPASVTKCSKCGMEFPRECNLESRASRQQILATPRWFDVDDVQYKRWKGKKGKPDTIRVDYTVSQNDDWLEKKVVSEWVCIEHDGFAHKIAQRWWIKRSKKMMPKTIEEALYLIESGATAAPKQLLILRDGAYDRIDDVELEPIPDPIEIDDCPF